MYNLSVSADPDAKSLTGELVWNAFYLHALLAHHHRRGQQLRVPHRGVHAGRFTGALDARNSLMAGVGQPMWAHACDECEKLIPPVTEGDQWSTERARVSHF